MSYLIGTTIGSSVMFLFGIVWLLLGVLQGRPLPQWGRMALLITGFAFATWIGVTATTIEQLSRNAPPASAESRAMGQQIRCHFAWIDGVEFGAIFLAIVFLTVANRPNAIAPAIAIIVGLHFLPLAGLFGAPLYYVTGVAGCLIGIAGFLISEPALRSSIVGLSFGLLLWLTTAAVLMQISRLSTG